MATVLEVVAKTSKEQVPTHKTSPFELLLPLVTKSTLLQLPFPNCWIFREPVSAQLSCRSNLPLQRSPKVCKRAKQLKEAKGPREQTGQTLLLHASGLLLHASGLLLHTLQDCCFTRFRTVAFGPRHAFLLLSSSPSVF